MNTRTKQIWLPGLVNLSVAMLILMFEVRKDLGPWMYTAHSVSLPIYFPWLVSLPLCGALGAYLCRLAGGDWIARLTTASFPALTYFACFALVFLIISVRTSPRFSLGDRACLCHLGFGSRRCFAARGPAVLALQPKERRRVMPDWNALVRKRLDLSGFSAQQQTEIVAELAAHLEDLFVEYRNQGLSEAAAIERAQAELSAKNLAKNIHRAKREKGSMNSRTKQLLLPGLIGMTVSIVAPVLLLWSVQWFRFHSFGDGAPHHLAFRFEFLIAYPFGGAVAAYLCRRAGGTRLIPHRRRAAPRSRLFLLRCARSQFGTHRTRPLHYRSRLRKGDVSGRSSARSAPASWRSPVPDPRPPRKAYDHLLKSSAPSADPPRSLRLKAFWHRQTKTLCLHVK